MNKATTTVHTIHSFGEEESGRVHPNVADASDEGLQFMDYQEATAGLSERREGGPSLLIQGDAALVLKDLPPRFFQTCITSPPYWGTRDYGVPGQIGAEDSLDEYVKRLVRIFAQVKRTLRDDGILWLNLGDVYTSGDRGYRAPDKKHPVRAMTYRPRTPAGLKPKDLIGVPWRVAFALQQDGWYLRSDIIWHKPNCMPESVKDRPTRSHEYFFMFTKSERYYYDGDSIKETNDRNRRTVWQIRTRPLGGNHHAAFPPKLIEPCILAGSREGDWVFDPFFGSGTVGLVCNEQGRRFVGIELSPEYVVLARKRLWARPVDILSYSGP